MTRLGAACLALLLPGALRAAEAPALTERQRLLHVLNRLTFGARPKDVERIKRRGIAAFVEEQLHPERIPDADCERALARYLTLAMSSRELAQAFPDRKPGGGEEKGGRRPREILQELSAAKLTRAVLSERQLQEVMTDFWFNHFNVFWGKNQARWLTTAYERDVIRPRALGKFRDLLGAVARSPAMLVYLDNFQSTVDARYAPLGAMDDLRELESRMTGKGKRRRLGLNENYARELMELHTLGVDGGYTQKDVTELARILTGWSVERPNPKNGLADVSFRFRRRLHDPGGKVLLGRPFPGSGEDEGERALDLLARHPSTARYIARKLCRRFVADDPPEALVARVAAKFSATDGDVREALRELLLSPEFAEARFWRAKVKSPLEFVAGALRVTGAEVRRPLQLARLLERMGQPLYLCEPPTGYSDRASAWVSSGALLARLQLSLAAFSGRPESPIEADPRAPLSPDDLGNGARLLSAYADAFLGGELSERTRSAILERLDHPGLGGGGRAEPAMLAALVLGSPDFQRR